MTLRHEPDISHADWFARSGEDWRQLCSIGPSGFAAYARIMHPTDDPPDAQGLLDSEGDLGADLVPVLCNVLGRHTSTPDDCLFGLWEGFGDIHEHVVDRVTAGQGSSSWTEPAACGEEVLTGPTVHLPGRSYFLFRGPLHDAARWPSRDEKRINGPSLIWPADHAWFVATDTDCPWTGVGGSRELVDDLLTDEVLDVVPAYASPDLPYWRE